MQELPSRLPHVGTTIFTTMSRLATQHGAINLGQGFPSYGPPPTFVSALAEAMRGGHHQYAPMEGLMSLREAIATKNGRCYGHTPDPATEITVTSGGTEALFAAIAAVIGQPGDEVILLPPCYDSYAPAVLLNGGVPVYVNLTYPTFRPDWEAIQAAVGPRTRAIIINTPHNPTGTIWTQADMLVLANMAEAHNLVVIADEVYEHMVFDGNSHQSLLQYPSLWHRGIVVHSFGKTYHATGWKMGYTAAPAWLTKEIRKVHQYLTFSSFTPLQHALVSILTDEDHYNGLPAFYQTKRDALLKSFAQSPLKPLDCQGTYFQLFSYHGLSSKGELEFATELIEQAKVATIPISSFYPETTNQFLLRVCFAKDEALMEQAAVQLTNYFNR